MTYKRKVEKTKVAKYAFCSFKRLETPLVNKFCKLFKAAIHFYINIWTPPPQVASYFRHAFQACKKCRYHCAKRGEKSEVCAVEPAECVTVRVSSYIAALILQEIRLEPVEEEVLGSKSVSLNRLFYCFCCGDHSVSRCPHVEPCY